MQVPFTVVGLENMVSQPPLATVRPTAWGSCSTLPHTCPCPPALGLSPRYLSFLPAPGGFPHPLRKICRLGE